MAVVTSFPTRKTHSGGEKEQENLAKIQEVKMTGKEKTSKLKTETLVSENNFFF